MQLKIILPPLEFYPKKPKKLSLEERKPKQGTQATTGAHTHTHTTCTPPSTVFNILLKFAQFPVLSLSILRGWLLKNKKNPGYFKLLGFTTDQRGVLTFPSLLYKQAGLFFFLHRSIFFLHWSTDINLHLLSTLFQWGSPCSLHKHSSLSLHGGA